MLVGKERVVGAREEVGVWCVGKAVQVAESGAGGWSEGSGGDRQGGGAGVDRGMGGRWADLAVTLCGRWEEFAHR